MSSPENLSPITPMVPASSSALYALLLGLVSKSNEICASGQLLSRASDAPGTLTGNTECLVHCSNKVYTSMSTRVWSIIFPSLSSSESSAST